MRQQLPGLPFLALASSAGDGGEQSKQTDADTIGKNITTTVNARIVWQ